MRPSLRSGLGTSSVAGGSSASSFGASTRSAGSSWTSIVPSWASSSSWMAQGMRAMRKLNM